MERAFKGLRKHRSKSLTLNLVVARCVTLCIASKESEQGAVVATDMTIRLVVCVLQLTAEVNTAVLDGMSFDGRNGFVHETFTLSQGNDVLCASTEQIEDLVFVERNRDLPSLAVSIVQGVTIASTTLVVVVSGVSTHSGHGSTLELSVDLDFSGSKRKKGRKEEEKSGTHFIYVFDVGALFVLFKN